MVVTLLMVDDRRRDLTLRDGGILADIAPTVLEILGIEQNLENSEDSK